MDSTARPNGYYRDGWPDRIATTGPLSKPTIPVFPQAARPAVSERETGPGRVPGCSSMPGAWKSQPAPGKAHGRREQDTVERHGGLDVVMEKIVQREQENAVSNGREMIDDFRLRGSRPCRHMGGHLTKRGWRTQVAHEVARPFNHPNAPLSEGKALAVVVQAVPGNPHWTRVGADCPKPLRLRSVRSRLRVSPLARRVVAPHGRRRKWRERPRVFWRWCATGQGEVVHAKIHHLPSPFRGRSLHSDPWREGHRALPRSGRINRPVRFPHRRRDLRSLRGESVQEAFRGVLVCQGVRESSLPGKARGFRGAGRRRTLPRRFSRHRGLGHGRGRRERRG